MGITVFFDETLSGDEIQAIGKTIGSEKSAVIKDMEYISAEAAWDIFKSEFFGENEETFSPEMMKYLSRLSPLQREVLHLISIGYTPNEILGELHFNKKLYDDCYNAIHAY